MELSTIQYLEFNIYLWDISIRCLRNLFLTIQFRLSNSSFQYWYRINDFVVPISKLTVNVFTSFEMDTSKKVYFFLYPNLDQGNITFPCHIKTVFR